MHTLHVLLAIPPLYQDLLKPALLRLSGRVEITLSRSNELKIATVLRELLGAAEFCVDDPVIVILTIENTAEIPTACSRLLMEFPEIMILGIGSDGDHIRSFQLRIASEEVQCSMKGLLDAIRECVRNSPQW